MMDSLYVVFLGCVLRCVFGLLSWLLGFLSSCLRGLDGTLPVGIVRTAAAIGLFLLRRIDDLR